MSQLATASLDFIRADLEAVEREFQCNSAHAIPSISAVAEYVRVGGGKRVRPTLLLLSARMFGECASSGIVLGAVVEIIHTATLVHDDIIDAATTRRGRPTANTLWTTTSCVLSGDWLFMQAYRMALALRSLQVLDVLTTVTQRMVEGELMQMESLGKHISEERYLELIDRKTACLFSTCTRLGAIVGRGAGEDQERMAEFGRNIGIAFQMIDDELDFTSSEATLGKPVCSDLAEGRMTMPVIHALKHCTESERELLLHCAGNKTALAESRGRVLDILNRYGAVAATRQYAKASSLAAAAALEPFPDSLAKRTLLGIAAALVTRTH